MRGTVGMKLLGMQIGHEVDGRTIDNNQAMVRIVAHVRARIRGRHPERVRRWASASSRTWSAFIWFLALLYTTAKSPTKQGLHDQYAHTMVVKSARRAG